MIRVLEDSRYGYNDYEVQYDQGDGLFHIIRNGSEIGCGFSSDRNADEFIDNMDSTLNTKLDIPENEDNNLPVESTTLKNLNKKYKNCTGIAYILSSEYNGKYATRNGIGSIYDSDLMIFKSAESARQSRLHRKSNFGIEEVKIIKGEIVW